MEEKQYVIFRLDAENYGVEIDNVSSITDLQNITHVPNAPDYLEGIINLRGDIIPLINLKRRFNMKNSVVEKDARIIVYKSASRNFGIIVDEANEVISISKDEIEEAPQVITGTDRKIIKGIGKMGGRIILVLDFHEMLSSEEVLYLSIQK